MGLAIRRERTYVGTVLSKRKSRCSANAVELGRARDNGSLAGEVLFRRHLGGVFGVVVLTGYFCCVGSDEDA